MLSLSSPREEWLAIMVKDPYYGFLLNKRKNLGWITKTINEAKKEFKKCLDWQYPTLGSYGYRK